MRSKKLGKAEIPSLDLETKLSALVWSRNRKSRKLNKPSAKMLTMRSRRPRRMEKLEWRNYSTTCTTPIFMVPSEEYLHGIFMIIRTHKFQSISKMCQMF